MSNLDNDAEITAARVAIARVHIIVGANAAKIFGAATVCQSFVPTHTTAVGER